MAPKKSTNKAKKAQEVIEELNDEADDDNEDDHPPNQLNYVYNKEKNKQVLQKNAGAKKKATKLNKQKESIENEIDQTLNTVSPIVISSKRNNSQQSNSSMRSKSTPRISSTASSTATTSTATTSTATEQEEEGNSTSTQKLKDLLVQASLGQFPVKKFENCGKMFGYTSYLHLTTSVLSTTVENQKIKFTCLFCDTKFTCELGKTSNIKAHLETQHKTNHRLVRWLELYNKNSQTPHNKTQINAEKLHCGVFFYYKKHVVFISTLLVFFSVSYYYFSHLMR
jgi:hypothetical protein